MIDFKEYDYLKRRLCLRGIPFEEFSLFGGYALKYPNTQNERCSVICHIGSYGHEEGLLEIMGLLTDEESLHDSVAGYLTGEDVFNRILCDYEKEKKED